MIDSVGPLRTLRGLRISDTGTSVQYPVVLRIIPESIHRAVLRWTDTDCVLDPRRLFFEILFLLLVFLTQIVWQVFVYASLVSGQVHVTKSTNRLDLPVLHSQHCLASSRFIQMIFPGLIGSPFIVLFPLYSCEQSLLILGLPAARPSLGVYPTFFGRASIFHISVKPRGPVSISRPKLPQSPRLDPMFLESDNFTCKFPTYLRSR